MSKQAIIGIDPGNTGALVLYDGHQALSIADMPTMLIVKNRKKKHRVEASLVANIIREWAVIPNVIAYMELVGALPKQGVTGVFSFGRGVGVLEGVLAALEIPYTLVTPQTWQKHQGVAKGKDASRARAAALFPRHAGLFARVKDDGRADATLIARYGSQQTPNRRVVGRH